MHLLLQRRKDMAVLPVLSPSDGTYVKTHLQSLALAIVSCIKWADQKQMPYILSYSCSPSCPIKNLFSTGYIQAIKAVENTATPGLSSPYLHAAPKVKYLLWGNNFGGLNAGRVQVFTTFPLPASMTLKNAVGVLSMEKTTCSSVSSSHNAHCYQWQWESARFGEFLLFPVVRFQGGVMGGNGAHRSTRWREKRFFISLSENIIGFENYSLNKTAYQTCKRFDKLPEPLDVFLWDSDKENNRIYLGFD